MKKGMEKTVRKFKAVLLLSVGLALFPKLASASMLPEQYPWPWPWAIGCPVRWTDLQGDHAMLSNPKVSNAQMDDRYEIRLYQSAPGAPYDVRMRRYDAQGLNSDGHAWVGEGRLVFLVKMTSYREHRGYWIRVRMAVPYHREPNRNRQECDDRSLVKVVVDVLPAHKNEPGQRYIVEPVSQN
jgi:hypothetical protein